MQSHAHAHAHAIFISTTTKPLPDLAANTDYVTLTLTAFILYDSDIQNFMNTQTLPFLSVSACLSSSQKPGEDRQPHPHSHPHANFVQL